MENGLHWWNARSIWVALASTLVQSLPKHCERLPYISQDYSSEAYTALTTRSRKTCPSRTLCFASRSEEHTSELQSQSNLVCRLLLEKKKKTETAEDCR